MEIDPSVHHTVLVVDDEPVLRELINQILRMAGHQCQLAANGQEALDIMGCRSFDAVITDICMPHIDGITLTREIISRYGDLPVMVITGYPDRYTSANALAAGAREFIVKPFTSPELTIRFDKMMADFARSSRLKAMKSELVRKSSLLIGEVKAEAEQEIRLLRGEIEILRGHLGILDRHPVQGERGRDGDPDHTA